VVEGDQRMKGREEKKENRRGKGKTRVKLVCAHLGVNSP
jgi:hypothetical protein